MGEDLVIDLYRHYQEILNYSILSGADPGFQVRGGAYLKKLRRAEGGAKNVWGISCEKSRFYPQKIIFFPILGGGGGGGGGAPGAPPLNPPLTVTTNPIEGESPDSLQTDG